MEKGVSFIVSHHCTDSCGMAFYTLAGVEQGWGQKGQPLPPPPWGALESAWAGRAWGQTL